MAARFHLPIGILHVSKAIMLCTVILIAAFQYYWLNRLYQEEWDGLQKESDVVFRDVMYKLQLQHFKNANALFVKKTGLPDNLFAFDLVDSLRAKLTDTATNTNAGGHKRKNVTITISRQDTLISSDSLPPKISAMALRLPSDGIAGQSQILKYFFNGKVVTADSLPLNAIDSEYKAELFKSNIALQFTILTTRQLPANSVIPPWQLATTVAYVGLGHKLGYLAVFDNPARYLLGKITLPVLFSLLLLAVTLASFIFLYRNLAAQQKLTAIKNEFIGNITHELKTPIATVTVAVEALRNFNALQNPERTKEYLDISALELKRLSMLVDKVLKLSMFENKQIELKKEKIDLLQLCAEIIAGMKLQFDKAGTAIQLTNEGQGFLLYADRLHITSVLYNLLDNALKYSREKPFITVHIADEVSWMVLSVTDNGIGIPAAYADKIFQKFFRVPSSDHHNIKGYGLGLSYVHHIVTSHGGTIAVNSTEGKGSTFTVKLPKA